MAGCHVRCTIGQYNQTYIKLFTNLKGVPRKKHQNAVFWHYQTLFSLLQDENSENQAAGAGDISRSVELSGSPKSSAARPAAMGF